MSGRRGLIPGLFAGAFGEMGRAFSRGVDGTMGRAVHGLGRSDGAAEPGEEESRVLAGAEEFLTRGRDLLRWWDEAAARGSLAETFELGRTFNEPARSFGFFDRATVDGRRMPVMGNYQEMLYDRPKTPRDGSVDASRWMRDQIREFVLHYFMRVSDFREPEGYSGESAGASCGGALSWCPCENVSRKGFGFEQLFYKLAGSGELGRFPDDRRFAIVDLREIGTRYEWIVLKVRIFDFNLTVRPLGPDGPQLVLPLQEDSYLILTRDFVRDEESPQPGVLGRYGIGYAFIKNPGTGFLAFGPGKFDAAIERIDFTVDAAGTTRVAMAFVTNRPEQVASLSLDPFDWALRLAEAISPGAASGLLEPMRNLLSASPFRDARIDPVYAYIDLANLLTGGVAARDLCISREQLEREFLVKHFMQHYQTIAGSLATWRQIGDWLDEASLPDWVRRGRSL